MREHLCPAEGLIYIENKCNWCDETVPKIAAAFVLINGGQSSGNVVTLRPNLSVVRAAHNT